MTNPGWAFGRGVAVPPDYKVDDYVNILEAALGELSTHRSRYGVSNLTDGLVVLNSAAYSAQNWFTKCQDAVVRKDVDAANLYATWCRERLLLTINIAAQMIVIMDETLGKPEKVDNE
jgi:hypothetical protein